MKKLVNLTLLTLTLLGVLSISSFAEGGLPIPPKTMIICSEGGLPIPPAVFREGGLPIPPYAAVPTQ